MNTAAHSRTHAARTAALALAAALVVLVPTPSHAAGSPPVAYDSDYDYTEGATTTVQLYADDQDGENLTFAISTPPEDGTLGAIGAPVCELGSCYADVVYTAGTGTDGADSFTYTANDGTLTSDPATVFLTVVRPPCGAVISNGTVQLGVNCIGDLNVPGPASSGGTEVVGLRFVATNNDSTSPGCACEGWGVADATSGTTGYANESSGRSDNLTQVSFVSDADSATSVVDIGSTFRVTHDYQPSTKTPNLYTVTVTIKNVGATATATRYRRVMDWDVEPTPFEEYVTLQKGNAAELVYTSDDGFADANPLAGPSSIDATGSFVDSGPNDHGALFDFDFGSLAPGASKTFSTHYGAAATETAAKAALAAVGAESYSFGQPSTPDGPTLGTPNTFIFAFSSVGGSTLFTPAAVDDTLSTPQNTAGAVNVLGNDTDPNGDPLTVTTLAPTAAHGTVSCTGAGVCTYTPAVGYTGTDSFDYAISDGNGGSDTGTVAVTVTGTPVDTPPDTAITGGPTGTTSDNTPTFTFTSTESGSTFECRVDLAAFATCTTPFTTTALTDGSHTFEVRATDAGGNTDPTPASRTFTVDTTPPDTSITGGPTGTTGDNTPTFTFTSTEAGSTFECRVDTDAFATCTTPSTTTVLTDGSHTFEVRAKDAGGNTDPTPASRTFTVDTTPPDTTITDGPTGTTTDNTPTFAFTGSGGAASYDCRLDAGAWAACASPLTTGALALGAHTFEVRAIDAVGNVDLTPAAATFTVTTPEPPAVTCQGKKATIVGTGGNDVLTGTNGNDVIVGLGGRDKISGGGGKDVICAGAGNDVVDAAAGKDVVDAGDGKDKVVGGGGDDVIDGGEGNDRLVGNGGDDVLKGGAGDDELAGAAGDDKLVGAGGDDVLSGDGGDDDLSGGGGNDHLNGGAGRDHGDGGPGDDVVVRCET